MRRKRVNFCVYFPPSNRKKVFPLLHPPSSLIHKHIRQNNSMGYKNWCLTSTQDEEKGSNGFNKKMREKSKKGCEMAIWYVRMCLCIGLKNFWCWRNILNSKFDIRRWKNLISFANPLITFIYQSKECDSSRFLSFLITRKGLKKGRMFS
jgi:hypothetical protein